MSPSGPRARWVSKPWQKRNNAWHATKWLCLGKYVAKMEMESKKRTMSSRKREVRSDTFTLFILKMVGEERKVEDILTVHTLRL